MFYASACTSPNACARARTYGGWVQDLEFRHVYMHAHVRVSVCACNMRMLTAYARVYGSWVQSKFTCDVYTDSGVGAPKIIIYFKVMILHTFVYAVYFYQDSYAFSRK